MEDPEIIITVIAILWSFALVACMLFTVMYLLLVKIVSDVFGPEEVSKVLSKIGSCVSLLIISIAVGIIFNIVVEC